LLSKYAIGAGEITTMGNWTFVRALCAGAFGLTVAWNAASAADLRMKAPSPPPPQPLDIHGFFDLSFKNDYITPRGLLVSNTGLTTQILMGLVFDVYKNPGGFINDVSIVAGVWNDLWSKQGDFVFPNGTREAVGAWNEFDWFVEGDFKFAQYWKFGVQYIEFIPPAHDLPTSFPSTERNLEFSLSYDDAHWGYPIVINPYVKLFHENSGPSTVVLGKAGNTYDVELGAVPTIDMKKYWGWMVTLSAPTWVTVGPKSYWNRADGTTNFCGPATNAPCATSSAGVFSTGLTAKSPIDYIIPTRLGNWYVKGGFQYYHILNDALLGAQVLTGAAGGGPGRAGNFPSAHRDVVVGFAGTGFTF
jgi:hypothetical protein